MSQRISIPHSEYHRMASGVPACPSLDMRNAAAVIAEKLLLVKQARLPNRVMTVAVEGLSNSGKSSLGKQLNALAPQIVFVEGDLFHRGTAVAMPIYERLVKTTLAGKTVPRNFASLIWNFPKLRSQILTPIRQFNASEEKSMTLQLTGVLENKRSGTEHSCNYPIDRSSIVLITGMYLRQLAFDQYIYLVADSKVTIDRKIERGRADGKQRDPELTRCMVELIELPALVQYHQQYPVRDQIVVDTSRFDCVSIKMT